MLKCLGVDDVGAFEFVTPPNRDALELALEELYALGALDKEARVVEPLGVRMARGPLPPVLMRLLLLAAEQPFACAAEAALACAMLALQQPWLPSRDIDRLRACQESFAVFEGDLVACVNILRQYEVYREDDRDWAKRHLLNGQVLEQAMAMRAHLLQHLQVLQLPCESCGLEVERLQRLACAALFLNSARRLPNGAYRLCRPVDGARAPETHFALHPSSVLAAVQGRAPADFVVFTEAVGGGGQAQLLQNTRIKAEWLPELAPHYFRRVAAGQAVQDV